MSRFVRFKGRIASSFFGNSAKEEVSMEKKYLAIVIICFGWMVSFPTAVYLHQIMNPPFNFDDSSRLVNIASVSFSGTSATATNYINMTIQNTSRLPWTLTDTAKVNGKDYTATSTYGLTCVQGYSITIKIANVNWISGNHYSIALILTSGFKITYDCTAP